MIYLSLKKKNNLSKSLKIGKLSISIPNVNRENTNIETSYFHYYVFTSLNLHYLNFVPFQSTYKLSK